MEKNTNMHNADELCLKYILNELDPSEVLLVEQAMKEDENVLIEIESLRATLRKLDKLPEVSPSEDVRQKILQQASEYAANQTSSGFFGTTPAGATYIAVAALLIVTISIGLYSYNSQPGVADHTAEPASETVTTLSVPVTGSAAATISGRSTLPALNRPSQGVQPWVDNNNVLRIGVSNSSSGLTIVSPDAGSTHPSSRLVPIEREPDHFGSGLRELQLTRTQY
ncbi:MAG: hypothetical protein LAT84_04340 [Balneolia bacterium]|nr:hypothetical protein [Balneolia bacterium]